MGIDVIELRQDHVQLAITIQNAIERAKKTNAATFIRIYPDGKDIHVGELHSDAALSIQEFINTRKSFKEKVINEIIRRVDKEPASMHQDNGTLLNILHWIQNEI